jgi:nitrite reductase/ring-hydroxylating ferredoxin subunit/multimeric flavodoxin WrbA
MKEWQGTGSVDLQALSDARLEVHYAVQTLAAAGAALVAPEPDDSHTSLSWSDTLGGFVGQAIQADGGTLCAGLGLEPFLLCVVGGAGQVLRQLELRGRTLPQALDWLANTFTSLLGRPVHLELPKHKDFPLHALAQTGTFQTGRGLAELGRYYANAAIAFAPRAGGRPVRVWPHHFDIALLADGPSPGQTIGVGLSPGDASSSDPYWYVTPWPYPPTDGLPALAGNGAWNVEGWVGARLPAPRVRGEAPEQRKQVEVFLDSAIAACRSLLAAQPGAPPDGEWRDVGSVAALSEQPLHDLKIGKTRLALTYRDGAFSAISGVCNHVGGPLGAGHLDGDYVVCPWHHWKFHVSTGQGEPGYEGDAVPAYETKVEAGRVYVNLTAKSKRSRLPHPAHPLTRIRRRGESGGPSPDAPIRVLGISTTAMEAGYPRASTSEILLGVALEHAAHGGAETRLLRLTDLRFRNCEGYYSKSAQACTWPCSITQMDESDQMDRVYEGVVCWADVILVATPIRWGAASSLYYKMAERMNCIQNQITIRDQVLMRNKVSGFIVTGGQDNVQAVVGQMLTFFAELGCVFPQFPFIGHSRGWSAEDMEHNIEYVTKSKDLRDGAEALVDRAITMAKALLHHALEGAKVPRGGRKAHQLDTRAQI